MMQNIYLLAAKYLFISSFLINDAILQGSSQIENLTNKGSVFVFDWVEDRFGIGTLSWKDVFPFKFAIGFDNHVGDFLHAKVPRGITHFFLSFGIHANIFAAHPFSLFMSERCLADTYHHCYCNINQVLSSITGFVLFVIIVESSDDVIRTAFRHLMEITKV